MKMRLTLIHICIFATTAHASLGGDTQSINNDHQTLGGYSKQQISIKNHKVTATSNYSTHELSIDGLTVREYTDNRGVVFAVTWQGLRHPDLLVLLGQYFGEYDTLNKAAMSNPRRLRGPKHIKSDQLDVSTGGHMRSLHGRAFAPQLVPAGVNPEALP